jgi:hypothetical protein
MMRFSMTALACAAMVTMPAVGRAMPFDDGFTIWEGQCSAGSYIADAPGSGHKPFPCNALIHIEIPGQPGHEQFIFVIKGDEGKQNGVMLGFGGMIDPQGNLQISNVQFQPAEGVEMAAGSACTITRDGAAIKRIQCSATAADGGGRAALIDFTATRKVERPY